MVFLGRRSLRKRGVGDFSQLLHHREHSCESGLWIHIVEPIKAPSIIYSEPRFSPFFFLTVDINWPIPFSLSLYPLPLFPSLFLLTKSPSPFSLLPSLPCLFRAVLGALGVLDLARLIAALGLLDHMNMIAISMNGFALGWLIRPTFGPLDLPRARALARYGARTVLNFCLLLLCFGPSWAVLHCFASWRRVPFRRGACVLERRCVRARAALRIGTQSWATSTRTCVRALVLSM